MPSKLKSGEEVVPGYILVRRLGAGASGEVWVARASGGVHVAIKVLSNLEMLTSDRELAALRIVRQVKHPNLCPLFGVWFFDQDHNLLDARETEAILGTDAELTETVRLDGSEQRESSAEFDPPLADTMPLEARTRPMQMVVAMGLGEQTLMDRLVQVQALKQPDRQPDSERPLAGIDPDELMRYMTSSAAAIDELNEHHNIYHCDIKPQNILLVGGQAQVCDFGLARKVEDSRKTTVAFGTPAYGAPEMLFERTYSKTIDQYSLAITYYELRTGKLPYNSVTQQALLRAKATGEVDLSRVPEAERLVLAKATALNPQARYENCQAFVHDLSIAINSPNTILAAAAEPAVAADSHRHRSVLALAAIAISVLGLGGISLGLLGGWVGRVAQSPAQNPSPEAAATGAPTPAGAATPGSAAGDDTSSPATAPPPEPDLPTPADLKRALAAQIDQVESSIAERVERGDRTGLPELVRRSRSLLSDAPDLFGDRSAEVARLALARLSAGLAVAGDGEPVDRNLIQSVRDLFDSDRFPAESKSAEAALGVARSWLPLIGSDAWDRNLAESDIDRAQRLNRDRPERQAELHALLGRYLITLLQARHDSETTTLTELNEETIHVGRELESDPAWGPLGVAAISLSDPQGKVQQPKLENLPVGEPGERPTGLPAELEAAYALGIGWAYWNQAQPNVAVSWWRQAAQNESYQATTAAADRAAVASHLLDHVRTTSGVDDADPRQLRYAQTAAKMASALTLIEQVSAGDADLIDKLRPERFICSVAGGRFADAAAQWQQHQLGPSITPQVGRALFDLSLNQLADTEAAESLDWTAWLMHACSAQAEPNLFAISPARDAESQQQRAELFSRCYRPTMDRIRGRIDALATVTDEPMHTALATFCDHYVSLLTETDHRPAYGQVVPYLEDLETTASIAAARIPDLDRRTELYFHLADSVSRQGRAHAEGIGYDEMLTTMENCLAQAMELGSSPFVDCLAGMVSQEQAFRETNIIRAVALNEAAIMQFGEVLAGSGITAEKLVGRALAGRARARKNLAMHQDGRKREKSLNNAIDDARQAVTVTPAEDQQYDLLLENKARLLAEATQASKEFKPAEQLQLIVEAGAAIDDAIAVRSRLNLDDASLRIAKLFVLGTKADVSDSESKAAAIRSAQAWMTATEELRRQGTPPRIRCRWYYNAAVIAGLEMAVHPNADARQYASEAREYASVARQIAGEHLDPKELMTHLIALAYVNLKSYEVGTKANPAAELKLIDELQAILNSLAEPTPRIVFERNKYLRVLEEWKSELR